MRLLMISNPKSDQQSIEQVLHQNSVDCDIVPVVSGSSTMLDQLQADDFDLIYFDLPDFDLFTQLVSRNFDTPIIFVAEPGNEALAVEALSLGASDYLIRDADKGYLTLLPVIIERVQCRRNEEQIYREQIEREFRQQTAQLAALRQLGMEITTESDLETVLQSIVSRAMELVGSQVIGASNLGSQPAGHFQKDQLPVLQQIADTVAGVIKNSQLYKIEQRKREEADTLREAALALTTALHQDEVIERILAQLQQVVPYDTCSVQLFREDRGQGQLEIVGGRGFSNMSDILGLTFLLGGDNPNTEVVRTRSAVIVDDAPAVYGDFQKEPHAEASIHSWLGVPMLLGNRLVGLIALDRQEAKSYTQEHAQLTEVFAAQAAVAIENARLYEEAQQHGETMSVLLNEVNHRVKNNLTGIIGLLYVARNRAIVDDQASYQATMDELIGRIRGLASVHTMLSESEWMPLRLTDLAYEIIHAALRALPHDKQVSVDIPASEVRITPDQAHNLALVINELATNTAKYALTDRNRAQIVFQADLDDGMIRCEFRDDGPGYPNEVLRLERHSVGFDLIQNIVKGSLRGELLLKNQEGAVAVIQFKTEV